LIAEQYSTESPLNIVVLISGNGSNLQAIIDAIAKGSLHAKILAVISNNAQAYGLNRAQAANIPTEILLRKDFPTREAYDEALEQCINKYPAKLVVLAGFMYILGAGFVEAYEGRLINIHPSLLPKYPGLNTHQQVIANGDKEHGATIHFVIPAVDAGPIITQAKLKVLPGDTVESIENRIHQLEHQLYPLAIQWFAKTQGFTHNPWCPIV
jgi:phosphoribosylglycinamide formyltransferase-1